VPDARRLAYRHRSNGREELPEGGWPKHAGGLAEGGGARRRGIDEGRRRKEAEGGGGGLRKWVRLRASRFVGMIAITKRRRGWINTHRLLT
jgi:hypothetical protein